MISKLLALLLIPLIFSNSIQQILNPEQINDDIIAIGNLQKKAQQNIWSKVLPNGLWSYPSFLGTWFLSEYYFEIKALKLENQTKFNSTFFTQLLLDTQQEEGSWKQVLNANVQKGSLDATIFNYWYLKAVGQDIQADHMQRARKFILDNGGIENSQVMTKFKLATFGQYEWDELWGVPYFIFKNYGLFKITYIKNIVSQWVYPHLTALTYLRNNKVVYDLGPQANIKELFVNPSVKPFSKPQYNQEQEELGDDLKNLPRGSYGAYTISTLLSLLALQDFKTRYQQQYLEFGFDKTFYQSLWFVEFNYFNKDAAYQGTLDDGRYWDTILVYFISNLINQAKNSAIALIESEENLEKLYQTADSLISEGVQSNGGIAYGWDFEYAPDIDDTGLLLVLLNKFRNKYSSQIQISKRWVEQMQNSNGGFAAFDKNREDNNWIFKKAFDIAGISGSAEIYDPSCADITGHVFEGFGDSGERVNTSSSIQNAINYLIKNQEQFGSWQGRWGINYIYSVGAVIPGLVKIGYDLQQDWVFQSIKWLITKQNSDGGFGESTQSYNDKDKFNGVGVSTVTQTAWGMLALLEVAIKKREYFDNLQKAATFLQQQFEKQNGTFFDISVVGTGHRGLLYLQYPSYADSFPLIALSRYKKLLQCYSQEIQWFREDCYLAKTHNIGTFDVNNLEKNKQLKNASEL